MDLQKENYMHYLPPIFWQGVDSNPDFLERFLKIFQEIFEDLEDKVDSIHKIFDAWKAPGEFIPWLASWLALELDDEWTERQSRTLISHIVSLYRKRGTIAGLETYLRLYVGSNVTIEELSADTDPHVFRVTINYPSYEPGGRVRRARQVRAIVDSEKPAHTHYELVIKNPTMQIGVHSTIAVDTILGTL